MAWHHVEEGIYQEIDPKTGATWPGFYVKYSVRGQPKFESAHTRSLKKARLYRASKLLGAARGELVGAGRLTVGDLLDALEQHYRLNDALTRTKRAHLALFRTALGHVHPADLVTPTGDLIEDLQGKWKRAGVTNATINRRCNVLRRALRWGQKKGKLGVIPLVGRLDESKSRRGKYLPIPEAARLEEELAAWVRAPFVASYVLGIRKGQICRTHRDYVDLTPGREIIEWPPGECKDRDPHVVPLQGRVLNVVRDAMKVAPLGCPYLFHGPRCGAGRKRSADYGCIGDFKSAFKGACRRAGLPYGRQAHGYTFHSTRHSAASNLRAGGMEEADAMKVTGHKTAHVFRHYEHGQPEILRTRMAAAAAELERQEAAGRARLARVRRRRLRPATAPGTLRAVQSTVADGRESVESPPAGRLTSRAKSAK